MLIISFERKDTEYFFSVSPKSYLAGVVMKRAGVVMKQTCGGQGILACDVMAAYVDARCQTKLTKLRHQWNRS